MKLLALLLLSACACYAQAVRFAWDASPTQGITNYNLYACTNAPITNSYGTITNVATPIAIVPAGTNTTCQIVELKPGKYWFYVCAQKDGIESIPSNILPAESSYPPANMRTLVVQYSATLTNGWYDVGFFKIKPGP